jgi:hypothetical protein
MDRQVSIIRAACAKQILAAAGVTDNVRLEAALSATRREDFLGAGPWWMLRRFWDYVTTPDADPVYLYTDDLVGILPERRINNGQPSLHAHLIHQAWLQAGEHVVHIGTGTGYYTGVFRREDAPCLHSPAAMLHSIIFRQNPGIASILDGPTRRSSPLPIKTSAFPGAEHINAPSLLRSSPHRPFSTTRGFVQSGLK